MPQNQPSGRGLLPSPTAWSPYQYHAAMLADVSRHILGRTEVRGLGVWSACPHSHREVSEMPIFFRRALRPQCPVRWWNTAICWARSSVQIGSRCVWYPPLSFFQSPLKREWRSLFACLWATGFCVCRVLLPIFASLSAVSFPASPHMSRHPLEGYWKLSCQLGKGGVQGLDQLS